MEVTKKEKKMQKKAYKKAYRKAVRPWRGLAKFSIHVAIILVIATVVVSMFDNTMALLAGGTFWELVNEDKEAIRYESDYKTEKERNEAGAALVKQVEAEGASLLMNVDKTLPLAK